jgi:hypothetical protein
MIKNFKGKINSSNSLSQSRSSNFSSLKNDTKIKLLIQIDKLKEIEKELQAEIYVNSLTSYLRLQLTKNKMLQKRLQKELDKI